MKISVLGAAAGGALMGKSVDAAKVLLEEKASNNCHWSSERATPKRSSGRCEFNVVTLLANRVDALAQRFNRVSTFSIPGNSLGSVGVYAICETYGVQVYTFAECCNSPSAIEHANVPNSFNLQPQNNFYSNTYNQE